MSRVSRHEVKHGWLAGWAELLSTVDFIFCTWHKHTDEVKRDIQPQAMPLRRMCSSAAKKAA